MSLPRFQYLSEEVIDSLRAIVSGYFSIYSTMIEADSVVFFCEVNESTLERDFEELRLKLRENGYIPMIKRSKGEYLLYVMPFQKRKGWNVTINVLMLILTVLSTAFAGIIHWASYTGSTELYSLSNITNGILYFAFPLLLILGTHEMGHYVMARKRHVRASLPFFIPFMPPLGTMGAFISLREPIPDKKSLIDIGIAGPIAGFIVAIPVTIIGMLLGSIQAPGDTTMYAGSTYMIIQVPLIYRFLELFIPAGEFMHPMAFAGWVGFIVTAINLFPAGQLDGGHIARAALGAKKALYLSYASLAILFLIGIFTGYWGWIIFGSLIFFLGAKHGPPLNDISPLDSGRKGLAVFAAVMLAISFVAVPLDVYSPSPGISLSTLDGGNSTLNFTVEAGSEIDVSFSVYNTGEGAENISIFVSTPRGWNASVFDYNTSNSRGIAFNEMLNPGEGRNYSLVLDVPENATSFLYRAAITASFAGIQDSISMKILIPGNSSFSMMVLPQSTSTSPNSTLEYRANIVSLSNTTLNLTFSVLTPEGWETCINRANMSSMHLVLEAYGSDSLNFSVRVPSNTSNGNYAVVAVLTSESSSVESTYLSVSVVQERSSR